MTNDKKSDTNPVDPIAKDRDDELDEALAESFPASDPPAPVQPKERPGDEKAGRDDKS